VDSDCHDTLGFVDEQGFTCSGWVGFDCDKAHWKYRYTRVGREELFENCPFSCNTCDEPEPAATADASTDVWEAASPCTVPCSTLADMVVVESYVAS
jgi:hypothetical protein